MQWGCENSMYKKFFKRFFDICLAFIGIVLTAIPMMLVAVLIKIDSPGEVLFKQQRIGYKGQVFNILKFRTMCLGAERIGSGVYSGKDDSRVTKIGKLLRAIKWKSICRNVLIQYLHKHIPI